MPHLYTDAGGVWRIPGNLRGSMVFGMANNIPNLGFTTTSLTDYLTVKPYMGGTDLRARRSFDSGFPSSWSSTNASGDEAAGVVSLWSCKPPVASTLAGSNDAQLAALASTIPAGSYVTVYHEPEAGSNASLFPQGQGVFRDYFRHVYSVMKQANPDINIGYVAMAYRWGSQFGNQWSDWFPGQGYTDFLGVDAYCMEFEQLLRLEDKQDFRRWFDSAQLEGLPLHVWEYGHTYGDQVPGWETATRADADIADIIDYDLRWAAENGFKVFSFWNCKFLNVADPPDGVREWAISGYPNGGWTDDRPLSRAAWVGALADLNRPPPEPQPPSTVSPWSTEFEEAFAGGAAGAVAPFDVNFDDSFERV